MKKLACDRGHRSGIIGQAVARRVSAGKHVLLANLCDTAA